MYKASNPLKYSLLEFSQIVVRLSLGPRYETLALACFNRLRDLFTYSKQTLDTLSFPHKANPYRGGSACFPLLSRVQGPFLERPGTFRAQREILISKPFEW